MTRLLFDKIFHLEPPADDRYPNCHCLIIRDDLSTMIDTCCGRAQAMSLAKNKIDMIFFSHFHPDHVGNHELFVKAKRMIHSKDCPPLQSAEAAYDETGLADFDMEYLVSIFSDNSDFVPTPIDKTLKDGDHFDFGSIKMQVIHTPGHTAGHCAFWFPEQELLHTADITLNKFGPIYLSKGSHISDFINSVDRCMELNPKIVLSGHQGLITENIKQRFLDYINIIHKSNDLVLQSLKEPQTITQLADKSFLYNENRAAFIPLNRVFQEIMIAKHLEYLLSLNLIKSVDEIYFRI